PDQSLPHGRAAPLVNTAIPARAPVRACVVEVGMPNTVARRTVRAAAAPTDVSRMGLPAMVGGTRPLPVNCLASAPARRMETALPARVAAVAQARAVRKVAAALPYRVATPLKLSLAPLL